MLCMPVGATLLCRVTPLPGRGSGCVPRLPDSLMKALDKDGDGKVSWAEMKEAYASMSSKAASRARGIKGSLSMSTSAGKATPVISQPAHTQCKDCGDIFVDDATFCRKCGAPRPPASGKVF